MKTKREVPLWVRETRHHTKNLSRRRKVEYKRYWKVHGPGWKETGNALKATFSPERVAILDKLLRETTAEYPEAKLIRRVIPGSMHYVPALKRYCHLKLSVP